MCKFSLSLQVYNLEVIRERLIGYLQMMNAENRGKPLTLIFFSQIIGHIVRVCRALRSDRSNILMVGVGGSGKETALKMAAYVSGYKIFTIKTGRHVGY